MVFSTIPTYLRKNLRISNIFAFGQKICRGRAIFHAFFAVKRILLMHRKTFFCKIAKFKFVFGPS
jgi:hypothetical protein